MGKLNRSWHEGNRMPQRATLDQRIAWHREHAKHCGCRPMPAKIAAAMKERSGEQAVDSGRASRVS